MKKAATVLALSSALGYQIYKQNQQMDPNIQEQSISSYFTDKIVLITGSSMGIGEALALRLSQYKTKLILCARSIDKLNQVAEKCKENGTVDVCVVKCDVTVLDECRYSLSQVDHVRKVVEEGVKRFGGIDCLFLNAGISGSLKFEDMTSLDPFEKMMKVNFMGYVHFTHLALPYLKKSKDGRIAVVSSISGRVGVPFRTAYCASKYAVNGFFDVLRNELAGSVKITILTPGWVDTDIRSRHVMEGAQQKTQYDKSKMLSIKDMVQKSLYAVSIGKREERYVWLQKLSPFIMAFAPSVMDKILTRSVRARL